MSNIPLSKYVSITSGVAGASAFPEREMIGRIFVSNVLVPTQAPLEFTSADEVGDHFGYSSDEYDIAVKYFGWVSPNITRPRKLSFGRYAPSGSSAAVIGNTSTKTIAAINELDDDTLTVSIDGYEAALTGINLSGAASISAALTILEGLVRDEVYGGSAFTGATFTYDSTTNRISLISGDVGDAEIAVSGTVADVLGLTGGPGLVVSYGVDAQTGVEAVAASAEQSDNFLSFAFVPALGSSERDDVAAWTRAGNVAHMYCIPTTNAGAGALAAAIDGEDGCAATVTLGEYEELAPMIICAAVDYNRPNGVMTPMFKQFSYWDPSVTTLSESNSLDAINVNYIGRTQSAGTTRSFYQPGTLFGGANAPRDINTYANEAWMKAGVANNVINLLLALGQVSATAQGESLVRTAIMDTVERAQNAGVIVSDKALTNEQKAFITQATNDDDAWRQVESLGYWLDVTIETDVVGGVTRYKATYLLIYSKADAIRKVEGTHALI